MTILLGFAFLSGLVTILAPCIWPLLPIVLSSSLAGKGTSHKRPLGVVLGIMVSFAVFTLAISSIVKVFHFDPNILRYIAVVVIGILGLAMIVPGFTRIMELGISRLSGRFGTTGQSTKSGFTAGFVTGISLGIVWSPCAGPILASIATLAATGNVSGELVLITIAYVLGVGIPLFIFAYAGQQFFKRTRGISKYTGRIQQAFGVIMILTAIAIAKNYDKTLQAQLLNAFPALSQGITSIDTNPLVKQQLDALKGQKTTSSQSSTDALFNANQPAPELAGITHWLNPDKPLTIASLKGKVVLVDFWTYTCINCIRTLPHVTDWYDKYKDKGFVVLGVHTPEFEFEKNTGNVEQAIKQFNIHYPVAQDNDYATWNAFNNEYWPAEYLIDAKGTIRRTHFGEGEYDQMEMAIQQLLKEAGKAVTTKVSNMPDETPQGSQLSPETYLGSKRMEFFFPDGQVQSGNRLFAPTQNPDLNTFTFGGEWNIGDEYAMSGKDAVLTYHFSAQKVYLVMRPPAGGKGKVKVFIDGKLIKIAQVGDDIRDGDITVDEDRLYNIVSLSGVETHLLRLEFETPGTSVFAFTFG